MKNLFLTLVTILTTTLANSQNNIWVKRPGTGEIMSEEYESLLGKVASRDIPKNIQKSYE